MINARHWSSAKRVGIHRSQPLRRRVLIYALLHLTMMLQLEKQSHLGLMINVRHWQAARRVDIYTYSTSLLAHLLCAHVTEDVSCAACVNFFLLHWRILHYICGSCHASHVPKILGDRGPSLTSTPPAEAALVVTTFDASHPTTTLTPAAARSHG